MVVNLLRIVKHDVMKTCATVNNLNMEMKNKCNWRKIDMNVLYTSAKKVLTIHFILKLYDTKQ